MKKIAIALSLATVLSGCMPNYSEGFRVGTLQKASKKGIIWKSFEGELVLDGVKTRTRSNDTGVSTTVTNTWMFSATDTKIMKELEEAANSSQKVKLTYSQWFFHPVWVQATPYTITKVELVQ